MDVENPMVIDAYWPDEDEPEHESTWERFCKQADEQYDEAVSEWQS